MTRAQILANQDLAHLIYNRSKSFARLLVSTIGGIVLITVNVGKVFGNEKHYVGEEAQIQREMIELKYPIEEGVITNWSDMEMIWDYIVSILNVDAKNHSVVLTEPPLNVKNNREKMTEIMLEKYSFPSVYIGNSAVFGLYSTGRTTGISIVFVPLDKSNFLRAQGMASLTQCQFTKDTRFPIVPAPSISEEEM